jgi:hypothetical protein
MSDYCEMLEALISKEKEMIGEPAIKQAREADIQVNDDCSVDGFEGSGDEAINRLIESYKQTTGPVAERIAEQTLSDFESDSSAAS